MVIKVGINGFGRIGRVIFRTCLQNPSIELSAINDPAIDIEYICYLIKFDSTHGKFKGNITHSDNDINIDGLVVKVFREKLPHSVPWQTAGVQYVIEASGMFTSLDKASGHLASDGVRRVIVTAPSVDVPMIILGVNDNKLSTEQKILSCASSTLYCLAPIVKVLEESYGVAEGFITSIHAMTPSLKPLDGLCLRGKHWRDHRSIHQNIIPASTGACKALSKILPQVKDKMSGLAFRVPIVNVSVLDLTVRLNTNTSIQDIIKSVDKASKSYLQNIIKISSEEAVSSDFSGDSHSCILDADSSLQLKPNFFKIICWYENEFSYACRVLDSIFFSENQFNKPVRLLPCKMTYVRAKLMKKQDGVQQTDRNIKEISIECNYNTNEIPKLLCSTSQETAFKRKTFNRPLLLRKPLSSHASASTTAPALNRDTKKRNELFKIWNDNNDAQKNAARQNRSSFFHSCIAFGPKKAENTDCMKAHERLENVKREFSKMVNITEDLLKKSYSNKLQLETAERKSIEGVKPAANGGLKEDTFGQKTVMNGKVNNPPQSNLIFNICGDFKSAVVASPVTDCSKEEVRCCGSKERNENNSDFNLVGEVKMNFAKKMSLTTPQEQKNLITSSGQIFLTQNSDTTANMKQLSSKSIKSVYASTNIQKPMAETLNNYIENLTNKSLVKKVLNESKETIRKVTVVSNAASGTVEDIEAVVSVIEGGLEPDPPREKVPCDTQTSSFKIKEPDPPEMVSYKEFSKYLHNKDYNMHIIDEELKKRNIVLVNNKKDDNSLVSFKTEPMVVETDERRRNMNVNKQILDSLNRMTPAPSRNPLSGSCSPGDTVTTVSNGDGKQTKPDLYDKLDSASASDSNNSFEINERKSQIIQITDLTNSLEDLARLDKICRIIEISDELSDKLFSNLDQADLTGAQQKKWSFKDLCERIQLDEFCNKVFGKTSN
uniref:Glyceraldehyde 3-phosphate dehydrogenase NAD(P) binding domain-containing protein n=1 Tax=Heliothis virescens TaxID=7102 RepID=A0A2A4JKW8_HELVI